MLDSHESKLHQNVEDQQHQMCVCVGCVCVCVCSWVAGLLAESMGEIYS